MQRILWAWWLPSKWIDGLIKEEFKLRKSSGIIPLLPTTSAYSEKIAINSKKIVDVKKLIHS